VDKDPALSRPRHATTVSQAHWRALSEDQLRQLYEEYRLNEEARDSYAARLAAEMSSTIAAGFALAARPYSHTSDAGYVLRNLTTGINALEDVRNLTYSPAFEDEDRWGRSWRNMQFHPEGLVSHGGLGNDPDIDALQL